jgi:hypothetical protein
MSNDSQAFFSWVLTGVAAVIAALSSALTYIFKLRENENSKRIDELKTEVKDIRSQADKCEDDRSELFAKCQLFEYKVNTLEKSLKSLGVDVEKMDVDGTKYSHRNDK